MHVLISTISSTMRDNTVRKLTGFGNYFECTLFGCEVKRQFVMRRCYFTPVFSWSVTGFTPSRPIHTEVWPSHDESASSFVVPDTNNSNAL